MHRRHIRALLAVFLVCALVSGGCLSVDPSVQGTDGSAVFEEVTVDEPWASNHVWATATLASTPAAGNVTTITIIRANGRDFSTQQIASGQTRVSLALPTTQNATLVATNSVNSTTIETVNVSVTGTGPFSS